MAMAADLHCTDGSRSAVPRTRVFQVDYEPHHKKPWSEIHKNWREGFLRFLESEEPIPEKDLLDGDRYTWLKGYSLAFILVASYDHHQEHLEKLLAWLTEHGN